MALGEFALIKQYFSALGGSEAVVTGVGDDAAVLEINKNKQLVSAIDTLVCDVHFPASANPADIARRCLRVNLSDLAAMGATPKWFTLALTLPEANEVWVKDFSKGLAADSSEFCCALVGGDTTRGPLTISIAMMGEVSANKALLRSGARPGDAVYVTGPLGAAAAALGFINTPQEQLHSWQQQLLQAYYFPQPRIKEGKLLQCVASAAIDVSDGLMADLGHIASQSGVAVELEYENIPIAKAVVKHFSERDQQQFVLGGGDDYELCFTVPADQQDRLKQLQTEGSISATQIGTVTQGTGVHCFDGQGHKMDKQVAGYMHFVD